MLVAILAHPSDIPVPEDFFTRRGHSLLSGPPETLLPVLKEKSPDILFVDPELSCNGLIEKCAPKTRIALLIRDTSPDDLERLLRGMPQEIGDVCDEECAATRTAPLDQLCNQLDDACAEQRVLRQRSQALSQQLRRTWRESARTFQSLPEKRTVSSERTTRSRGGRVG